jgi:glucosamine--fructose-6-phosphate aminotransferase (isomerizing)
MDDYEIVVVKPTGVSFSTIDGRPLVKTPTRIPWDPIMAEKGGYKHFMLKEIHEQPRAVRDTLLGRVSLEDSSVHLEEIKLTDAQLTSVERMQIVACGTSWHAGHVGKFLIEQLAKIPVDVDYASEYRYRKPMLDDRCLSVFISQSGRNRRHARRRARIQSQKAKALAICNVRGSMLTRECDGTIYTHAGPEIGVASTKAFTSQITAIVLLALKLARSAARCPTRRVRDDPRPLPHPRADGALPQRRQRRSSSWRDLPPATATSSTLGRGVNYPIALEGALKLKEISYIHAEGYPPAR